mmetsp:Transcript_30370/g.67365  ORF Transcript_30370/g.67365 Transcript_30370/m.67365 type:complete len:203 (-) Transcript_30370:131-739(-)
MRRARSDSNLACCFSTDASAGPAWRAARGLGLCCQLSSRCCCCCCCCLCGGCTTFHSSSFSSSSWLSSLSSAQLTLFLMLFCEGVRDMPPAPAAGAGARAAGAAWGPVIPPSCSRESSRNWKVRGRSPSHWRRVKSARPRSRPANASTTASTFSSCGRELCWARRSSSSAVSPASATSRYVGLDARTSASAKARASASSAAT